MSHFAEIRPNGLVINVIRIEPDLVNNGVFGDPHKFIQTSYNGNFRNKFAKKGDKYDRALDMFISPQPYPSWILNETTCEWDPPVAEPELTEEQINNKVYYIWNETTKQWDLNE